MTSFVVAQLQAERRWLTIGRLLVAGCCLSSLLLLLWAVPSTPIRNPDAAAVVGSVFGAAVAGFALASWVVWRPILRGEPLSEFVPLLFGGQKLIRTSNHFRGRLAVECRRAHRDPEQTFTLIVIRLPEEMSEPRLHTPSGGLPSLAAMLVRGTARIDDVVADAPPNEVWLIARGLDSALRGRLIPRLARALNDAQEPGASPAASAQLGVSTFGDDGTKPRTLFSVAYDRLVDLWELDRRAA